MHLQGLQLKEVRWLRCAWWPFRRIPSMVLGVTANPTTHLMCEAFTGRAEWQRVGGTVQCLGDFVHQHLPNVYTANE